MPEMPETLRDHFPPEELVRRIEELRARYQKGAMAAESFNAMLKAFQFNDDAGHLWTVGANSGQWYRWDRTQWTAAPPPPSLMLASPVFQNSAAWLTTAEAAKTPATMGVAKVQCAQCKRTYDDGKFCTACGGKLEPVSSPATASNACAACGSALSDGTKFCPNCGKPVGAAQPAPAPVQPAQPARCPNPSCRKPVTPGKKFCTSCGTRFAQPN